MATTYTVKEVARLLKFGTAAVYRLAHSGELPFVPVGGQLRFTAAALRKYLQLKATDVISIPTDGATSDDTNQETT